MTKPRNLTEYKQQVTAFFDTRTNYDNDFTYRRAVPVVELAQLQRGQQVLDVATGTGILAIAAAQPSTAKNRSSRVAKYRTNSSRRSLDQP